MGAQDPRRSADPVSVAHSHPDDLPAGSAPGRWASECGAILVTSLVKFVLIVGILGIVGFDTISIGVTGVQIRSSVQEAAQVGHDAYADSHNMATTYAAVAKYAKAHDYVIPAKGVVVATNGSVTVTFVGKAHTIGAQYIGALDQYVEPQVQATASNAQL